MCRPAAPKNSGTIQPSSIYQTPQCADMPQTAQRSQLFHPSYTPWICGTHIQFLPLENLLTIQAFIEIAGTYTSIGLPKQRLTNTAHSFGCL
jgi:hypothetical protein